MNRSFNRSPGRKTPRKSKFSSGELDNRVVTRIDKQQRETNKILDRLKKVLLEKEVLEKQHEATRRKMMEQERMIKELTEQSVMLKKELDGTLKNIKKNYQGQLNAHVTTENTSETFHTKNRLLVSGANGRISLFDLKKIGSEERVVFQQYRYQAFHSCHFLDPSTVIAAGNSFLAMADGKTGEQRTLQSNFSTCWDIAPLLNTKLFALGCNDGTLRIFSKDSQISSTVLSGGNVRAILPLNSLRKTIACVGSIQGVSLVDIEKQSLYHTIQGNDMYGISEDASRHILIGANYSQQKGIIFDTRKKTVVEESYMPGKYLWSCMKHPTKPIIFFGSQHGKILLYDIRKFQKQMFESVGSHTSIIYKMKRISDTSFATCCADGFFKIWKFKTFLEKKNDCLFSHSYGSAVYDACVCATGNKIYGYLTNRSTVGDDLQDDEDPDWLSWNIDEKRKNNCLRMERIEFLINKNKPQNDLLLRIKKKDKVFKDVKFWKSFLELSTKKIDEEEEGEGDDEDDEIVEISTPDELDIREEELLGIFFRVSKIFEKINLERYKDYFYLFRILGYLSEMDFLLNKIMMIERLDILLYLLLTGIRSFERKEIKLLFFPKEKKRDMESLDELISERVEYEKEEFEETKKKVIEFRAKKKKFAIPGILRRLIKERKKEEEEKKEKKEDENKNRKKINDPYILSDFPIGGFAGESGGFEAQPGGMFGGGYDQHHQQQHQGGLGGFYGQQAVHPAWGGPSGWDSSIMKRGKYKKKLEDIEKERNKKKLEFETSFCSLIFSILKKNLNEIIQDEDILPSFLPYLVILSDYYVDEIHKDFECLYEEEKEEKEEEEDEEIKIDTNYQGTGFKFFTALPKIKEKMKRKRKEELRETSKKTLRHLHKNRKLTNLVIESEKDGRKFNVHKEIMIIKSPLLFPYLKNLDSNKVVLPFSSFDIELIIEYCYNGRIESKNAIGFNEKDYKETLTLTKAALEHVDIGLVRSLLVEIRRTMVGKNKEDLTKIILATGVVLDGNKRIQKLIRRVMGSVEFGDGDDVQYLEKIELKELVERAIRHHKVAHEMIGLTKHQQELLNQKEALDLKKKELQSVLEKLESENL